MRSDFNKEAMREKVKNNMDLGFTIPGIKIALQEEQLANLKAMNVLEQRNLELADQIEFMEEEYGK